MNPKDYELISFKDPIIHTPTENIDFNNPQVNLNELENLLKIKLKEYGGLGLSANQLGIPYSAFAISFGDYSDVKFNPKIVWYDTEELELEEGCLTYPKLYIKIKRPVKIRVRLTDINGNVEVNTFTGLTSRAVQHEYDHTLGLTFTRFLSRLKAERLIKSTKKNFDATYTIKDLIRYGN